MAVSDFTMVQNDGDKLKFQKINTFDTGGYYPPRLLNMVIASMTKSRTAHFTKQLQDFSK